MHVPRLLALRRSLIRRWRDSPPDVFVGIDAPDFNFGLEKALKKSGVATVHYVSPSIWAWRAGRIETVRKAADRVLCILPFEKRIYDEHGIDAVFVGHPKADSLSADIDIAAARASLGLDEGPLVAILPGSRGSELSRLGPHFAATAAILAKERPDIRFVTPIASPDLRPVFESQIAAVGLAGRFHLVDGDSIRVMSAADIVLLASGTAALESALLGKPTVAAYQVAKTTAFIARMIGVHSDYFTIPNLLTETPLIPEFMQENMTPQAMADAVATLLDDPQRRGEIAKQFATLRNDLALGTDRRAADAVVALAK
jgi:lipid-A-disaccharide synthase